MDSTGKSLRSMIEKWLAPTSGTPIRLTRFSRTRSSRGQYVCVEISRPAGSLAVFFFRHEDGTWRVFPTEAKRPAMSVSLESSAAGESSGSSSAESVCE